MPKLPERRISEIQVRFILASAQNIKPFQIKNLGPSFPTHHEVRYNFDDGSEMILVVDDLKNVKMPGDTMSKDDVPFKSIQHFNRQPENLDVEEFNNHLQYAKFLSWLNDMPSTGDVLEIEIKQ